MEAENSGSKCRICGATFDSQKAVHGHMRKHSLSERQAARDDAGQGSSDGSIPPLQRRRRDAVPQPCLRCGKVFSSGQALGAHKRHCKGPPPPPPVENQNKAVRDFDLNELPPPEERGEV